MALQALNPGVTTLCFPHLLLYCSAGAKGGLAWTVPEKLLLSLLCAVVEVIDQVATSGST